MRPANSTLVHENDDGNANANISTMFNREKVNLESHQLVWADANINNGSTDSVVTLQELRKIIDYTRLFDNVEVCKTYIEQSYDTTTFLVCSGQLGEQLVPLIHGLKHILSIYIYCLNKEYHQLWALHYSKVTSDFYNINHRPHNMTLLLT
jgi:hypothetical protein